MTHLPQHPADEVATKADIAELKERFDRMEARFDALNLRFDSLHQTMHTQFRNYTITMVGSLTALTAIYTFLN